MHYWKLFPFFSPSGSPVSVNHPSSPQMRTSCSRNSLWTVAPVFYRNDHHRVLHSASHPPCSPIRPASPTRRSRAAVDRPLFTSLTPSSRARGQDQWDATHTTLLWAQTCCTVTSGLQLPSIRKSLCLWLGSLAFWPAVSAQLLVRLAHRFTYFYPARPKERRQTGSLWTKASWMSSTAR